MILCEVVVEGARCFRELRRIPLKPGYNLLYGASESGKTTLTEVIYILLDPLRNVGEEEEFPSWGPPGNSRAGLIIQEGQEVFRLTKDFVNGLVSLSKKNPDTQKFDPIATDPSKIDNFLRRNLEIPPMSTFKKLFCFDRMDLPSGRPKVVVQKVAAPAAGMGADFMAGMGGAAPAQAQPPPGYGLTLEEKKRRIEELRKERDKSKEIADLQFEIDGLEGRLFEIENKVKDVSSMEDQLSQVQKGLDKLSSFQDLPRDVVRRIEDFEGSQREQNKTVTSLDSKIGQAQGQHMALKSRTPFFKEQNFMIGAGALIGGIVLFSLKGDMAILKLASGAGIVAGIILMAIVLSKEFTSSGEEKKAEETFTKLREELTEIQKKFEVESSVIKRMMEEAGLDDPKELQDKMKEYKHLTERAEDLEKRIEKAKKASNFAQLEKERSQYQERIEGLNTKLRALGGAGFLQDPDDIQRQIDAMQYSIDHPDSPPPPAASAGPGGPFTPSGGMGNTFDDDFLGGSDSLEYNPTQGPQDIPEAAGDRTMMAEKPASGGGNPVDMLWSTAEAYSGLDRSTLIMQINDRFKAYVKAFTNGTYNEGDLSSEKTLSLRSSVGSYVDLEKLPPSSQDAAWLALKISLIENLIGKKVMPVIMDDPLRLFDDMRLANISNALKAVGGRGQVILISTQRAHGKLADNAISIMPPQKK